jgi:putative SOS response-associated peptidase YedK
VKWPSAAPNLEPRDDIWPTDRAPVIRRLEDGTNEFSELRWGFPPARPQGCAGHQFPFRGATVPGRSLSGTGITFFRVYRHEVAEDQWKFTKAGEDWFCFAGLWRPMAAGGDAFTLLTIDPSPDVAPIHGRQMVVLERSRIKRLSKSGKPVIPERAIPDKAAE